MTCIFTRPQFDENGAPTSLLLYDSLLRFAESNKSSKMRLFHPGKVPPSCLWMMEHHWKNRVQGPCFITWTKKTAMNSFDKGVWFSMNERKQTLFVQPGFERGEPDQTWAPFRRRRSGSGRARCSPAWSVEEGFEPRTPTASKAAPFLDCWVKREVKI